MLGEAYDEVTKVKESHSPSSLLLTHVRAHTCPSPHSANMLAEAPERRV